MRESKTHLINGFNYTVSQLGAKEGRRVLARILRSVAGAATAAGDLARDGGDATEAALSGVAKLVENLSDADVDYLCDTFAATTMVGPEGQDVALPLKDQFNEHFAGKYGDMVKWLWASLETNYGSFLGGLGLNVEALVGKAKTALTAQKTSTPASPTAPSGSSSSPASGG
jgi:hypothetical protein